MSESDHDSETSWGSRLKEELCRRPILVAMLGLCSGLSGGFHWSNPLFALLLVPLVWKRPVLIVLAVSVASGWIIRPFPAATVSITGGVFDGTARVIEVPSTGRSSLSTIVESKGKRYRLQLPRDSDVNMGDTVRFRADILPLLPDWMPQRLEVANLRPVGRVETVHSGFVGWKWSMALRRSFVAFVESNANPVLAGLLQALCLNVTSDVGPGLYEKLKRTGTVHIVSASGFHVALVSFAVAWLFLALPVPRYVQLTMLAAVLGFYAAAAGFHAPMLRSVVMVLVGSFAYALRREPDGLSALSLAGIVDLLWRPEDVSNIGFQLSFLAVASLVLFGGLFVGRPTRTLAEEVKVKGGTLVWSSLVASVASAPLLAFTFHQVSVVSVVCNLLVVPDLPFAVVGCIGSWILSFVSLPIAVGLLKTVVEPSTGWILGTVETMGAWPWATVSFPRFSAYWVVVAYVCLFALYSPTRKQVDTPTIW